MASVTRIQATVLTTAAILSLALGEREIIPSRTYANTKAVFASRYSWESENRYFFSEYEEIFDKYETIHRFASKIFEDSQDLEPSIVEFVSMNFWKLI
jgi:hypothetical protein